MTETIKTITLDAHPDFRARIVLDDSPSEPYDDGGTPIVALTYRRGNHAEQVKHTTSYVVPAEIIAAAERWSSELEKFERYLRIYHGTSSFDVWYSSDDNYVTFDTAEWRESLGITDEWLATRPGELANMDEWKAYVNGDVYGIIVEKLEKWVKASDPDEERDDWEEVDSVWGFYGDADGYPTEEATAMLTGAAEG